MNEEKNRILAEMLLYAGVFLCWYLFLAGAYASVFITREVVQWIAK